MQKRVLYCNKKRGGNNRRSWLYSEAMGWSEFPFWEIQNLAQKDENGNISGIWGAMSDFSRSFQPWEDFNKGLYLAGVECNDDAEAPDGWTKWVIPGYEYIYVERENGGIFPEVIQYLADNNITLVGAVHEFTCPQTGKGYMFFPIKKL